MYHFAGLPTKEERLISGLGLGGSGQNYDLPGGPSQPAIPSIHISLDGDGFALSVVNSSSRVPRLARTAVYGDGRRCPHNQSAADRQVCRHLTGKSSVMILITMS